MVAVGGNYNLTCNSNRITQTNTETGVRTEYVVNTVSELSQVLVTKEISKNSETTKVTTYVYGNGLLTQQSGKEYFVFHYNNIGSTILLTNATGEEEESYSYGPYGELLSGDNTKTNYLYNGMYGVATDNNGLYYMRARYYNVSIKRFINQDIVTGSITNSQSLNKFSYVQGNPISLTDPFGLSPNISLSGIGHAALNLLGIIPGLDICDAVNAAWYMAEGDYANAAMCMVAVLPMLGSIAGNGIKWGMKAGTGAEKVADTVKLGSRLAGNGGAFILSGGQAVESVKNIHANYVETGEVFSWNNAGDFLTLGLSVAGMGAAGASVAKSGATLKSVWKGNATVEPVAVSNATKRVDGGSKNGTYFKMDLQFFSYKSGKETRILYRGDNLKAHPDIIFEQGFKPKGSHNNALLHNQYNSQAGNFVSASRKSSVAEDFATAEGIHDGYVYIIHTNNYIDMNASYGNALAHPHDYEFLIPGGVKPSEIEGTYKVQRDYSIGEFIQNPNFGGN